MTAITIRLRDDTDHEAIEAAKLATHQVTTAKALMSSARRYPDTLAKLRAAEHRIQALNRELAKLREAVRDWQRARNLERETAARLEEIATR